ncbi:MAG: BamA/TamA family outer membrane protein [candidate division WOR-3 bacterium]|nr:MAG: BamA/TamA family outer membrane protein [candidate division WOR-3 bacterium]
MQVLMCIMFFIVQTTGDPAEAHIGLTLSAGGALGFAHIGVLKVLEHEQIPISYISANSMGSIIGGLYAAGYSVAQIESIAVNQDWQGLLNPSFKHATKYIPKKQHTRRYVFRWSHDWFVPSVPRELISLQKVEFLLMSLLSKIEYDTEYSFDRLRIPLRVIAVDIVSGRRVIMKGGRLDQVIRGSIAIPAVFAPQTATDEGILVDGGVLQYFPVDPLHEFSPDMIIASLTLIKGVDTATYLTDVISRVTSIVGFEDIAYQKSLADIVIEPDLTAFDAQDYGRVAEIIEAGEKAAQAQVAAIHNVLAGRSPVAHHNKIVEKITPYVRNIDFKGLEQTRKTTILKEIRTGPNMPLDFDLLVDDLTRIYETGLFSHVDYQLLPITEDSVDIIVNVDEQSYGFYLLGIRYDNADNATIGIELGQSNILGTGLSIRGAIHLGDPNEYRLGLMDTRAFALPLGYQVDLFWNSLDRSYYEDGTWKEDYNVDCRGGIAELGYAWAERSYVSAGIKTYQAVYRFPESVFTDTLPQREWVSGPDFSFEIDNYDDPYFPIRGGNFKVEIFCALTQFAARNDALRLNVGFNQFIPVTRWFTINVGLETGSSTGRLAWAEYFHTGGADFIGFANDEFTTLHRHVLHVGLGFPILSLFTEESPVILQLLANIGSFEPLDTLLAWNDRSFNDFELGIGAGIYANTPIGPLHIVFGFGNPHRRPVSDNIQYRVHFSLGREFRYAK